ncbi:hypothetical protein IJ556_06745 [bacterium]|nr:hypothetical protein [bacterium]MBR1750920.1 hypothetical protein [Ruminococcus sp.]
MTFEQALRAMREGKYIYRTIKDKDSQEYLKKVNGCMRIFNRTIDGNFKMNEFTAFLTTQDIFADDWEIYDDTPIDETARETMEKILKEHQISINAAMEKARVEFLGEDFDKPYETRENEHKALKEALEKIRELEEKCKYWQDKYDGALHKSINVEKELQDEKRLFQQMETTLRVKDERINYLLGEIEVYEKLLGTE